MYMIAMRISAMTDEMIRTLRFFIIPYIKHRREIIIRLIPRTISHTS